jgi:SulP family sulfate permease
MCTAINEIDLSAFEVLESVNEHLREVGVVLHLSEVKGPIMDCLEKTEFLEHITGNIYLSQHQALADLDPLGERFNSLPKNPPASLQESS